jgi:hypothetical protein
LLHDEYTNANRRYCDDEKPSPKGEGDDHGKQRADDPCDLKLSLEAAECSTVVGAWRISLH